jgi:hypothetical protein
MKTQFVVTTTVTVECDPMDKPLKREIASLFREALTGADVPFKNCVVVKAVANRVDRQ